MNIDSEITKDQIVLAGILRRLFRSRYLLRSRGEKWFQLTIENREAVQKILGAFLLQLEINDSLGVAYIKPISDEAEEKLQFQMGRQRSLSASASALLIKLRMSRLDHIMNPNSNDIPLISFEEIKEFLKSFDSTKIDTQFEKVLRKSIEELAQLEVLIETRADSGLFEITPICELILPFDEIQNKKTQMENYFKHFKLNSEAEKSETL